MRSRTRSSPRRSSSRNWIRTTVSGSTPCCAASVDRRQRGQRRARSPRPAAPARRGTASATRLESRAASATAPTSSGERDHDRGHAGPEPVDRRAELERSPWCTSQRAARSTSRRTARNISFCAAAGTARSSASIAAHVSVASNTSRATTCARASTGRSRPVSSHRRERKLIPARLTTALATTVAMISRRSGCAPSASSNPVRRCGREVGDEVRVAGTDRRARRTRPAPAAARAWCTPAAPRARAR